MTNQELYKTAESRRKAYNEFCDRHECVTCPLSSKDYYDCQFDWLELPADVQLKPCPFCGGEAVIVELKKTHNCRLQNLLCGNAVWKRYVIRRCGMESPLAHQAYR